MFLGKLERIHIIVSWNINFLFKTPIFLPHFRLVTTMHLASFRPHHCVSPQLLREVLLDPLHVVPQLRALGHPELGQVVLLPAAGNNILQ